MNLDSAGYRELTEEFGHRNVEDTLLFIARAKDSGGRLVSIQPTETMVRGVLEAVHGRTAPSEVRLSTFRG